MTELPQSVISNVKVMKHYFMFVYMVYSLKMVSTKDHRGLWLGDWYAYLR